MRRRGAGGCRPAPGSARLSIPGPRAMGRPRTGAPQQPATITLDRGSLMPALGAPEWCGTSGMPRRMARPRGRLSVARSRYPALPPAGSTLRAIPLDAPVGRPTTRASAPSPPRPPVTSSISIAIASDSGPEVVRADRHRRRHEGRRDDPAPLGAASRTIPDVTAESFTVVDTLGGALSVDVAPHVTATAGRLRPSPRSACSTTLRCRPSPQQAAPRSTSRRGPRARTASATP